MDFVVYVKGGDKININILENRAELAGKNTKENVALYKWEDFAADVRLLFNRTYQSCHTTGKFLAVCI